MHTPKGFMNAPWRPPGKWLYVLTRFVTRDCGLGRLVDPSNGDRCGGKEGAYGGRLTPLQPGMCAGSGVPMRGANVVRRRSVTNPGDPASAAADVSGGPADG